MKEFEGCFKGYMLKAVWMGLDSQKESQRGFLSGCTISTVEQPLIPAFSGITAPPLLHVYQDAWKVPCFRFK